MLEVCWSEKISKEQLLGRLLSEDLSNRRVELLLEDYHNYLFGDKLLFVLLYFNSEIVEFDIHLKLALSLVSKENTHITIYLFI